MRLETRESMAMSCQWHSYRMCMVVVCSSWCLAMVVTAATDDNTQGKYQERDIG